jgi:hypothetical protein
MSQLRIRVITNELRRNDAGRIIGIVHDSNESKSIDWNDRSDRKWLEKHQHWAMLNNREVAIYPEVTHG